MITVAFPAGRLTLKDGQWRGNAHPEFIETLNATTKAMINGEPGADTTSRYHSSDMQALLDALIAQYGGKIISGPKPRPTRVGKIY